MVKLLTAAGGTKTPSSLPAWDEHADPLFSHPPPWLAQEHKEVQSTDKAKSVQPKESLYGFLKKGSTVIANKPVKAVGDSSKKSVEEIINKKDDKIKECSNKIQEQNLFPSFNARSKENLALFDTKEELVHIETLKEKCSSEKEVLEGNKVIEPNDINEEKLGLRNFTKNMNINFLRKIPSNSTVNCDVKVEEDADKTIADSKFNKLIKTFSSKHSKDTGGKVKGMPGLIEKLKQFLSSGLTKQTIKNENGKEKLNGSNMVRTKLFTNLKREKSEKPEQEETRNCIETPEESKANKTNKSQKFKTYSQQLLKNLKSKRKDRDIGSAKSEETIGFKIQSNFEHIQLKLSKNSDANIKPIKESPGVTNIPNKLEKLKKICTISFKQEDRNRNKETIEANHKEPVTGIKDRFLKFGQCKKNHNKDGENKTSKGPDTNDQNKNKFYNLFKREDKLKEEGQTKVTSHQQPKNLLRIQKDVVRAELVMSKYQWTVVDGQWRKAQSDECY